MLFYAVFLASLFIGLTVAQTNTEKMASLRQVHSHINAYVQTLSRIFGGIEGGSDPTLTVQTYELFTAKDQEILSAETNMPSNQKPTATVNQVTKDWRNAATAIIKECCVNIDQFLQDVKENEEKRKSGKNGEKRENKENAEDEKNGENEENVANIKTHITKATSETMGEINRDSKIIDEHKREKCPIFSQLENVVRHFDGLDAYKKFRQEYGPIPTDEDTEVIGELQPLKF